MREYTKNCPQCQEILEYKNRRYLLVSIKKNTICKKCSKLKHKGPFKKECPDCSKIINYSRYSTLKLSIKENRLCKECYYNRISISTQEKKEREKEYRQRPEVKNKKRKYFREIRKEPIKKLNHSISSSILSSLKSKNLSKNRRHWENLVGYSVLELKKHIEHLFKPGMNWNNYGFWHIDHIIPKSFFKYKNTNDTEFKYCWSLNNLRPLWKEENLSKSDTVLQINPPFQC